MQTSYERAIVEHVTVEGNKVMHILPVDGTEILDEHRRPVWCWNALSEAQQRRLIEGGSSSDIGAPEGDGCERHARILIETVEDEAPGPRFYCYECGAYRARFLAERDRWAARA
jgi:hypothetical protein